MVGLFDLGFELFKLFNDVVYAVVELPHQGSVFGEFGFGVFGHILEDEGAIAEEEHVSLGYAPFMKVDLTL